MTNSHHNPFASWHSRPLRTSRWPLSIQQSSHLQREATRGRTPYGPTIRFASRTPADTDGLHRALARTMQAHPALRAAIDESTQTMDVFDGLPVPFRHHSKVRAEDLPTLLAHHEGTIFDRRDPPLWSCELLSTDDGEDLLSFTFDHLIFDAISCQVFLANLVGRTVTTSPPDKTYGDYATWQRSTFRPWSAECPSLDFWHDYLCGTAVNRPVLLPFCRGPAEPLSGKTCRVTTAIGPAELQNLNFTARLHRTTTYTTFLAALCQTLTETTGQNDFSIRIPVSARPPGYENSIGWFSNDIIFRLHRPPARQNRDLLEVVRTSLLAALDNQMTPYELVRDHVERHRLILDHRPAQLILNQVDPPSPIKAFGAYFEPVSTSGGGIEPGLHITLAEDHSCHTMTVDCRFDAARFAESDVAVLLANVRSILTTAFSVPIQR